jgi:Bacteriophage HK97-gp10, putative tail-component
MFEISLKVPDIKLTQLEQKFRAAVKGAIEDTALELADELQQASPEGATGDLKRGWDVQIKSDLSLQITNSADNALFRIRGRKAGKMPPWGPGSELAAWAEKYDIPPFILARAIARNGNQRFRDKKNFAGINPDGSPQKNGIIDQASKRLAARLRKIKI